MKIRKPTPSGAVLAGVILVLSLALVPAAFAAKGGGGSGSAGGGGHKTASYTGSFVNSNPVMVTDTGTSGLSYGDVITFSVTSNATYYDVELDCSQNGAVVFQQVVGFGLGWTWSQNYTLRSGAWTGGAADCTAVLFAANADGSNRQNLASLAFSVAA